LLRNLLSGGWCDLVVVAGRARGACPAARPRLRLVIVWRRHCRGRISADRRRKNVERKAVVAAAVHTLGCNRLLVLRCGLTAVVALGPIVAIEAPRTAIAPRESLLAILLLALLGLGLALRLAFASVGDFVVALVIVGLIVARTALLLVVEPRAVLGQDAEVMIRILQIIFGLYPIAGELRIARHALVFLEQLGGIAALAIVLAVAGLAAAEILPPLSSATAPAAALSLIDQLCTSLC
jgi:hypothetical protein